MNGSRRNFVKAGLSTAVGAMLAGASPGRTGLAKMVGAVAEKRKWNILYITADDLAPKLGCYGDTQAYTPNIDAFARESVLFERCFCSVAICTAARSNIITGVRPETSDLYALTEDWRTKLPNAVSLPQHLRNNGYATFSRGKVVDSRGGTGDEPWGQPIGKTANPNLTYYDSTKPLQGVLNAESAISTLNQLKNTTDPWFLGVGFGQPHCPFNPSTEGSNHCNRSTIDVKGVGVAVSAVECDESYTGLFSGTRLTEQEARELTCRYYGEVADFDKYVGEILAKVKELGLWDSTIVIVWCGDHGYQLGDNNSWGKWNCHNGSTWVPLLMRVPGINTAGSRTAGMVETVDMYPTLCDVCGLQEPADQLQGFSFAPLLTTPDLAWKSAVFSSYKQYIGTTLNYHKSIKTKDYRLIMINNEAKLYDHRTDWAENVNIAAQNPDIVAELRAMLNPAGWEKALPPETTTSRRASSGGSMNSLERSCKVETLGRKSLRLRFAEHLVAGHAEIVDVRGRRIWQSELTDPSAARTIQVSSIGFYSLRIIRSGYPSEKSQWFFVQ